jgi:hypothetical protein
MATIKITQLPSIGNALAANTVLPVVNTAGTATTDKTTVGNIANFTLSQAGNTLQPAFLSSLAYSVANSAQPNITSLGTLTSLVVSDVSILNIPGGNTGYVLQTDGEGNLSWTNPLSGIPAGANTQIQFNNNGVYGATANFTYDINTTTLTVPNITGPANSNLYVSSGTGLTWIFGKGGALVWPGAGDHAIQPNIDDAFEMHSHNNVVISTDVANSNNHFTFATDGVIYAPSNVVLAGSTLFVGPGAPNIELVNPTMIVTNSASDYVQAAIVNTDSGSADWIAYGNSGTDVGGWGDMGFTSIGFSDPNYTITKPGDGYFFVQGYANDATGGNLVIATGNHGNTKDIIFATGGFLAANEFARISDSNNALELYNGGNITGATKIRSTYSQTSGTTITLLGSAATAGAGTRAFVTDANLVAAGNFGVVVSGSGSNAVPVYSDGTNWRIG